MTDLRELEKRLETATAPSRELDDAVFRACGLKVYPYDEPSGTTWGAAYPVTKSLDAAVALVERVLPGWYWASHSSQYWDNGRPADKCFLGGVYDASPPEINGKNFVVHKQTAALALCLALIRALIAKGDRHD